MTRAAEAASRAPLCPVRGAAQGVAVRAAEPARSILRPDRRRRIDRYIDYFGEGARASWRSGAGPEARSALPKVGGRMDRPRLDSPDPVTV